MKRIITTIAALAVSLAFVTTAEAKKPKADKDPAAEFDAKDTDKDGFLTKAEFVAGSKNAEKAEKAWTKISKGADKISKADFVAAMGKHKKKAQ